MTEINHTERKHAKWSPSTLDKRRLCLNYTPSPFSTNAAAEKGTRIHEALDIEDPSGLLTDEEVELYEKCLKYQNETIPEDYTIIKEPLLETGRESTWGYADLTAHNPEKTIGFVEDWKTGYNLVNPPEDNFQAISYTLGMFNKYPDMKECGTSFYFPALEVDLQYTFKREDFFNNQVVKLYKLLDDLERDDNPYTPHPSACEYCAIKATCPAMNNTNHSLLPEVFEPNLSPEEINDPEKIQAIYYALPTMKAWIKAFEQHVIEVRKDNDLEGIDLINKSGSTSIEDLDSVLDLAKEYGVTDEEIHEVIKINLGDIEKLVYNSAKPKYKKLTKEDFRMKLLEGGFISQKEDTQYVRLNKNKKKELETKYKEINESRKSK